MGHSRAQQQNDVPADHKNDQPRWDQVQHREGNKSRCEQELVGERVKKGPEFRALVQPARDGTIDRVSGSGQEKRQQRESKLTICHEPDVDWDEENTENRQAIGNIHGSGFNPSLRPRRGIIVMGWGLVNAVAVVIERPYNPLCTNPR